MALNQIAAFPNPLNSRSVGTTQSPGNTTTTVYTAASNDKVSSFSITAQLIGTAGTDFCELTLTIGTAKFVVMANSAASFGAQVTITSDALGYKGGYLQSGDTITFQIQKTGTPSGVLACALAIDNYTV